MASPSTSLRSGLTRLSVVAVSCYLLLGGASFRTFLVDVDGARLAILLLAALSLRGWYGWCRDGTAEPWAVALTAWSLLTAITALNPRGAAEAWLWLALGVGLYALGRRLGSDPDTRLQALGGLLPAVAVIAGLACLEGLGRRTPDTLFLTEFRQPRAVATLNHPNNLAGFLALLAPLVSAGAATAWTQRRRLAAAALSGLGLVLLAAASLTYSKGGQLALLGGLSLLVWLLPAGGLGAWWRREPRRARWTSLLVVLAGGLLLVLFWRSHAGARVRLFIELLPTLARFERWGTWLAAGRMVAAHPLFGVGPGCFGLATPGYQVWNSHAELYTHAHNWYVNVAAESGLPGVALLLAVYGASLRGLRRRLETSPSRLLDAGLYAGLGGFALAGILDYNVGVPAIGLLFWFLLGLAGPPAPSRGGWRWAAGGSAGALAGLVVCWLVWSAGQEHYLRCCLAVRQGHLERAAAELAAAQRWDPVQPAYALAAVDLARWAGQDTVALTQLEARRGRRLPLDSYYADQLAWLRLATGGDVDEAVRAMLAGDPAEPVLRVDAGFLELARGERADLTAAERRFREALTRSPNACGAWVGLGAVAARRGQASSAAEAYEAGAAVGDPHDRVPRFLIAYGRPDLWAFVPPAQRAWAERDRVRYHGSSLPRWRCLALAAAARATIVEPAPDPPPTAGRRR